MRCSVVRNMAEYNSPPSYESVVQPDVRLTFLDFWPKCLNTNEKIKRAPFEQFNGLLQRANDFLLSRSDIILKNVQTVAKKCSFLENVYNGCLYYKYGDSHAAIVYGLRLWFAIDPSFKPSTPLQLRYIDLKPKRVNSSSEEMAMYPRLDVVIREFNEGLVTRPLEGNVVSIDTVTLKIDKEIWKQTNGTFSTEQTSWPDVYKQHLFQFLRIFYLIGPPKCEFIGIQDFVPRKTSHRSAFGTGVPDYTSYSSMISPVQEWIKSHRNHIIKNINTVETIYISSNESGQSGKNLFTTQPFFSKIYGSKRVRFMRVGYIVYQDESVTPQYSYPELCYKTFVPGYLGGSDVNKYQSMTQLMKYALSWLNAARANVVCAEFFGFHHDLLKHQDNDMAEISADNAEWYPGQDESSTPTSNRLVYIIRVYLDRYYPEPPPESLVGIPSRYDNECQIL